MNLERHVKAHRDLYRPSGRGRGRAGRRDPKAFYDEYFAVLDLAAEFYLETVERVFQDSAARPRRARRTAAAGSTPRRSGAPRCSRSRASATTSARVGQTLAAHDLCTGLRPYLKRHHLQAGRRPLRRVQRPPLGDADLPDRAQLRALGRVSGCSLSRGSGFSSGADDGLQLDHGLARVRRARARRGARSGPSSGPPSAPRAAARARCSCSSRRCCRPAARHAPAGRHASTWLPHFARATVQRGHDLPMRPPPWHRSASRVKHGKWYDNSRQYCSAVSVSRPWHDWRTRGSPLGLRRSDARHLRRHRLADLLDHEIGKGLDLGRQQLAVRDRRPPA